MSKSSWIIFVVVVVALFGGLVVWTRAANPSIDTSAIDTSSVLAASEASGGIADHAKGNVDSKAVIVEYGDFQCGGCAEISKVVKEFMAGEYAEKVALVYRNFNIPSFTNSRAASGTAEAAGRPERGAVQAAERAGAGGADLQHGAQRFAKRERADGSVPHEAHAV